MSFLAPERWDGVHFTEVGADLLGRVLVPKILEAADLPPRR
jgi:lysophospholipase L1-like esterase